MAEQVPTLASFEGLPETIASFRYLEDSPIFRKEKPYFYQGPLDTEHEHLRTNVAFETHENIPVRDLRTKIPLLSLDAHGLEMLHRPSKFAHDLKDQENLNSYLLETNEMLKDKLGAEKVLCYDVKFRKSRNRPGKIVYYDKSYLGTPYAPDEPAWQAHSDSTVNGGKLRVRRHMTEAEACSYFDGNWRIRIVNVWRPMHHVVEESPLAFCDIYSVGPTDLVDVERPSGNRIGHVAFLKYNPNQQWYWISRHTPDEVLIFIGWDSEAHNASQFLTHAAFQTPEGFSSLNMRESVETRAIVITRKNL